MTNGQLKGIIWNTTWSVLATLTIVATLYLLLDSHRNLAIVSGCTSLICLSSVILPSLSNAVATIYRDYGLQGVAFTILLFFVVIGMPVVVVISPEEQRVGKLECALAGIAGFFLALPFGQFSNAHKRKQKRAHRAKRVGAFGE